MLQNNTFHEIELLESNSKITHKEYLYVIVREDLEKSYQSVQAGHAVFKCACEIKFKSHPNFVYLTVNDLFDLNKTIENLTYKNLSPIIWREPDFNNEIMAIAIGPISSKEDRKLFKNYKLMKGD